MKDEICKRCGKSHKIKNTGPLTVCEREGYLKHGSKGVVNNKTVVGFGIGQNRYQHSEAK